MRLVYLLNMLSSLNKDIINHAACMQTVTSHLSYSQHVRNALHIYNNAIQKSNPVYGITLVTSTVCVCGGPRGRVGKVAVFQRA